MPSSYPAPTNRIHVEGHDWARKIATDYWLIPGNEGLLTGETNEPLLASREWTTTSLVYTAGSAADFLSASDSGVPIHYLTNADTDLLQSPPVIGDYIRAHAVARVLGYTPTKVVVEWYGAMTVHSADESRSGWGLVENGGTAGTDNDAMAWIRTDGTNFICRSAGDADTGAADDANWHLFRITVNSGVTTDAIEWFIDGTSQGTIDRQDDLWPCSFGMYASTTNRPGISWIHWWYE